MTSGPLVLLGAGEARLGQRLGHHGVDACLVRLHGEAGHYAAEVSVQLVLQTYDREKDIKKRKERE
jgi:hypothetical protein